LLQHEQRYPRTDGCPSSEPKKYAMSAGNGESGAIVSPTEQSEPAKPQLQEQPPDVQMPLG
jgi:hypothetical protein